MASTTKSPAPSEALIKELLDTLDHLFGYHAGFRAVHAKGVVCSGTFAPAKGAGELTKAPHVGRASTPVVVRLSDFAGVPGVPDNAAEGAGPRGMGIRFYLAEHVHTDFVGHSADGFPARTGEEFMAFAKAIIASPAGAAHPSAIEKFLAAHAAALRFVQMPKPFPTSFARESFFGISAFKFTNAAGVSRYGRYRVMPDAGNEYLSDADAAKMGANYLMEEMPARLAKGPVKFVMGVQMAGPGDDVTDATAIWGTGREVKELGMITLNKMLDANEPEIRKIILDPRPGVEGIEASDDPLFEVRAAIYILSGRRRRGAGK